MTAPAFPDATSATHTTTVQPIPDDDQLAVACVLACADLADMQVHPRLIHDAIERYKRARRSGFDAEEAFNMAASIRRAIRDETRFVETDSPRPPRSEDRAEGVRVMLRAAHGWFLAGQLLAKHRPRYMPEVDDLGERLHAHRACSVCGTRCNVAGVCDCVDEKDGGRRVVVFDYLHRVEKPDDAPATKKRPALKCLPRPRVARSGR